MGHQRSFSFKTQQQQSAYVAKMKDSDNGTKELEELREAHRANPGDRDAGARLAQHYADLGWLNDAEELLQGLTKQFPEDYSLHLDFGNLCFRRQSYDDALRLFRKLTELRPERIEGWNNLGIVQLSNGDHEGARASFARVLELEPDNFGALLNLGDFYERTGETGRAIDFFERAVAAKRDFADGWYNLGNAYLEAGRYRDAIDAFGKALRYQPEFGSAMKNLGFACECMGDLAAAEEHYLGALEHNKADAALYVNLGAICTTKKEYDRAKDYFLRAVKLAPKDAGGWMGLRHLSLLRGDIATYVRATLAIIHRLGPDDIAESIRRLRELEHFTEAEDILRQADRLSLAGDELDAERLLHYQRSGTKKGKIAALVKRLSAVGSPSDAVRARLGRYYLDEGDLRRCADVLAPIEQKGIAELQDYWTGLERLERWSEARESLEEYLEGNPDCAEAWLHLARVALSEGYLSAAQSHVVRARRIGLVSLELLETVPELKRMYEALGGSVPEER